MRRQPDLLDAALQASRTSLDPGSIPNGAVTTARAESKAPSPSAFAAAGLPRPSVGGLSPMAQPPPPAEERLLPNGNVCHFAGCGCADGVSGEIRAALKECVSNMRQQQQLQQQQQQQQQAGGPCGCPSLLRGACEHQSRQQVPPSPQPLKSLLKRPSTARPRRGSRVRFSDTLTVFSEDYPEAQLYVIRTAELTFAEVCSMYEPPPEYRDLPPFDPPDGYRDDAYLLPFLKEARAAAAAARAAAAAANGNNHSAVPQGTAAGAPASQPAPQGPAAGPQQVKVAERPPPPPPPPRPAFINSRATVREDARLPPPPPPVRLEITPVETKLKVDVAEADSTRTEENLDKSSTPAAEAEDVKTVVVVSEEEGRSEDEDPAVIVEDEDEAILLELKKQLECNSGGDIEADLAELLPPGLVLADVDKDLDDDVKVCFERDRKEDLGDSAVPLVTVSAPAVTTVTSSSPTTPTTPTSDERQDDSDSSADSQDTIILMTNEEEKKVEDAEQPTVHRGGFRQKLLIIGDKSPSDTSSVSSSTSQDSDASLRSTESTSTTNSEDRTESPAGSSGSSGRANPADDDEEYCDEEDGDLDVLDFGPHSNSQVRKTIERTAMRRSLTRVTDVRKRSRNLAKSPTSSNDVSLVEKLRWLTSLDDDDPNGCLPPDAQYHQQMQRRPSQDGSQDRALPPSAYPRPMFQQRPASFSQLGDSRGSLTMIPVAPRDYRMVRRVPGENHPQQNRVPPPPPPRPPPSGDKETPPDELERFVQQDMERTERIRKRYSLSEDDEDPSFGFARRPSVRGIRSRFGSTSEILKEVQLHHPGMNLPGSHLSWSHPVELPPNHKTPQQVKVMLLPRVAEEDPVGRNYGSAGDIATLTRSRRIFQQAGGPPPTGTGVKDERGVPEGACASPKVPPDPIYHVQPKTAPLPVVSEAPQGVVYYSLNV